MKITKNLSNIFKKNETKENNTFILIKENGEKLFNPKDIELEDNVADIVIRLPKGDRLLTPMVAAVPLQLLAYYTSVLKGNDVDKPRNLAKSVTVE